jgi:hypothetical protein
LFGNAWSKDQKVKSGNVSGKAKGKANKQTKKVIQCSGDIRTSPNTIHAHKIVLHKFLKSIKRTEFHKIFKDKIKRK